MKSNWNYPTTMWVGKDRIKDLSIACKNLNINKPLLVTDNGLAKSTIVIDVINNLKENGILIIDEAGGKVSDISMFGEEAIDIRASNSNIYQKMLEKIKNF